MAGRNKPKKLKSLRPEESRRRKRQFETQITPSLSFAKQFFSPPLNLMLQRFVRRHGPGSFVVNTTSRGEIEFSLTTGSKQTHITLSQRTVEAESALLPNPTQKQILKARQMGEQAKNRTELVKHFLKRSKLAPPLAATVSRYPFKPGDNDSLKAAIETAIKDVLKPTK